MKFNPIHIVASLLVLLMAFQSRADEAGCIRRASQLDSSPQIQRFVDEIGGLRSLEATWHFSGILLLASPTTFIFQSREENFMGLEVKDASQAAKAEFANLVICPTQNPKVIRIQSFIRGELKKTVFARVGSGQVLELSLDSTSFVVFNKIPRPGVDRPERQIAFNESSAGADRASR